jgi:adenosylcobinamide-phosphate synthase
MQAMSYPALFSGASVVDPLMLLVLGILLDALAGGVKATRLIPGPTMLLERMVGYLVPRLNRSRRSSGTRLVRGLLLVLFTCGTAGGAGLAFLWLAGLAPAGWVFEVILITALLGQGTVFMDGIRAAVVPTEGADPDDDSHQAARERVETLAQGFIDRGVAPLFWFLLLGLPGMLVYRAIEVTARGAGEWDREFRFGWAAARCYDAVTVLPAVFGSLMLIVAGLFVPQSYPLRGLGTLMRGGGAFPSFAQGWPVAAVAGVLGLSLGGPRPDADELPWISPTHGRAMLTPTDVRRALFLYGVAGLLVLVGVLFTAVIRAA